MSSRIEPRAPLEVAVSVWKALFLRDAVRRLRKRPFAWGWLILEPIFQIAFLVFLFSAVRLREIGGIDIEQWLMVGFLVFMMFRFTAVRSFNVLKENSQLFLYRQVKGVDAVFVRVALEGFLHIIVTIILFAGASLIGLDMMPDDPLTLMLVFFAMWLVGAGMGLIGSVAMIVLPALGAGLRLSMMPLFFASGVIFPIANVPDDLRFLVVFNPLAHGPDAARHAFSDQYQPFPELNLGFLLAAGVWLVFFGLALHVRYASRLTQG